MVKLIELNKTNVKLLYQASKDGFDPSIFHAKCDGVSATLTVIKSNNSNIFGGYTAADWSEYDYKSDSTAFLFSLVNSYNISVKMNVMSNGDYAILSNSKLSIVFGYTNDLVCYFDQCLSNLGDSYNSYKLPNFLTYGSNETKSFLGGDQQFKLVEIEVYWIDRKELFFVNYQFLSQ